MIGAPYEFDRGKKTKDFTMFGKGVEWTDDSVMTIAVAEALLDARDKGVETEEAEVKKLLVAAIAGEEVLRSFANEILRRYGCVDFLVNNAPPLFPSMVRSINRVSRNPILRLRVKSFPGLMTNFRGAAAISLMIAIRVDLTHTSQPIVILFMYRLK